MTSKPERRLRLWWLPLVLLATVHGQDKPLEPPAPVPTTAVRQLLDAAVVASNDGDAAKALGFADRAFALAKPAGDVAGQAFAQRARASQLAKLNRNDEAQTAWHEAETAWTRIGDGPGQVEALSWQAVLVLPGNAPQGTELLRHALTLAGTETKRPRAVTSALVDIGRALVGRSLLSEAGKTFQAAVTIAEGVGPESLQLASSLNGLGVVTYTQGDLSTARDLYQRALAIREKLAPNSFDLAASLNNLGLVALGQGNLSAARDFYQRRLAIQEKLAPNSLDVATSLSSLGALAFNQGDLGAARDYGQRALAIREKVAPDSLGVAASLNDLGNVATRQGDLGAARDLYERALAIREKLAPNSLDVAASLNNLGIVVTSQGDLSAGRDFYQRSLAIRQKLAPNSRDVAASLNNLGMLARDQGDLSGARDLYQRALASFEKLAPDSLDVASSLNNLGDVAIHQGDLSGAREYVQRALAIREKLAPNSIYAAASLSRLGDVAFHQGDLSTARDFHQRALAIQEKLAPTSLEVAGSLENLGAVALNQGELSAARDFHQRALAIREKLAPGSLAVAGSLNNLGNVARDQGDLSAARDFDQRALAIQEKLAPNSLDTAGSLNNLGDVADQQGDLSAARDFAQRALAIREGLAPDSLDVAASLTNLGNVAAEQGDLTAAGDFHQRALAIQEKLAPNSLDVAENLNNLGLVASRQGDLSGARDFDQRALAIRESLAPNSVDMAFGLRDLGQNAYDRGDPASAAQVTARAWAIVRAQAASVAGDEARQAFGSRYQSIGSQLVQYQIALNRTDDAFATSEEGRAQALLQLLAERDLARRLAPADVWQRYTLAQTASDQAGKALENSGAAEANASSALAADRAQATEQVRQAYTRARVEAEGRWADVRHAIEATVPRPVGAAEARRVLPPDTVLAEFVVGDEASTLFLVRRDGPVQAFPLALSLKELAARVDFVRRSVSGEADTRGIKLVSSEPVSDETRVKAARDLFQKLFPARARDAVGKAKRVLLSPDGVLWELPFAALVINDHGTPRYLGLEKPLVYAQSLTTFAQTMQAAAPTRGSRPNVVVVGNPLYDNALRAERLAGSPGTTVAPSGTVGPAELVPPGERALLTREGATPAPLPYAEAEANQVAALYGAHASIGVEPTEAWFRQHAGDADIIHLATHGYFNPFRATSSGLLLAVPEHAPGSGDTDNDGALQAWEIMSLQLRADVVVLSACQTGVGAKVPGEGLVGLTRAFQVAGATSIVATQWSVADRSTATGMVVFHQNLLKGLAKDEALRQAMRTLASDPATANPYYWAPFVLVGDFRPLRTSVPR